MPYEFSVDEDLQILWVRYSGAVTVAERRAAAEHILGKSVGPEIRRILLDYRRATSSATDDEGSTALAGFLADKLADRGARVAWLVNYDHQLDPVVETRTRERGLAIERFRDFDQAIAWLQRLVPAGAGDQVRGHDATPDAVPFGLNMKIGSGLPRRVHGQFDVKLGPQSPDNPVAQAAALTRLSLDKRYHGPLDAVGQGEMLAEGGGNRKDGAYVAMERVTGTLHGRRGSFALVHRALMRDGVPQEWTVVVVPGSGTGELAGLDGSMRITVEDGMHIYAMDYTLPG